ncbi:serine hydrolase domain-containing protein [Singulisphaera acidiphila]|uniref:Penicillin-binding protein, beta-lactamase class C n=1 Tax=Singulisphaera acidiphila (strain ATCC BAA-1392 / DSM 18658 / VKM B-2454 / MOB10) TaxID=886293 RepID=L0DIV2_SINAD|nr:serine hydrolase domain-containing protein [Singulisphaera acidiphila]AGA28586.1 penicillin-binding protein, beta-lactamase class C [Singulisphaera acidiphila DSM 18658]
MRVPHPLLWPVVTMAASLLASLASAHEPENNHAPATEPLVVATGIADVRLASFDRLMTKFLTENKLPGASLAVARNGQLVYARGFGLGDVEAKTPVEPDSLFRIASISKPITAAAVLQLIERGKLKLDAPLVDLLDVRHEGKPVPPGDPRLKDVTVRHLLQHRGGWDRDKSFDPMFRSVKFANELGTMPPATSWQVITAMWSRPLDFAPGERNSYSNYGYCLLGRIIEQVSGMPYEAYVRKEILEPLAIDSMRIGKTLIEERAPGEVRYVMGESRKKKQGPAVLGPSLGEPIAMPYGGWYLEAMDAHGAWLASAPALVRFASAFDAPQFGTILNESSIQTMFTRPEGRAGHKADGTPTTVYYACGWNVRTDQPGGGMNTWHGGYLDGSASLLVRRHDGLTWAVLFNSDTGSNGKSAAVTIDPLIHQAANAVKEWPIKDLFLSKITSRKHE